ncbi:hypothetical protein AX16_009374 [Volvariella volvacea WC 439]|nr:hypothetical protein AX16_009374 [Volvariella volvacea WC 439]
MAAPASPSPQPMHAKLHHPIPIRHTARPPTPPAARSPHHHAPSYSQAWSPQPPTPPPRSPSPVAYPAQRPRRSSRSSSPPPFQFPPNSSFHHAFAYTSAPTSSTSLYNHQFQPPHSHHYNSSHLPQQISFLPSSSSSSTAGTSPKFQFSNFAQTHSAQPYPYSRSSSPPPRPPTPTRQRTPSFTSLPNSNTRNTMTNNNASGDHPPPPLPPSVALAIANFRPTSREVISGIAPHVFDERPRRRRRSRSPRPYWYPHGHANSISGMDCSDYAREGIIGAAPGGTTKAASLKASSPLRMSAVISLEDCSIFVSGVSLYGRP